MITPEEEETEKVVKMKFNTKLGNYDIEMTAMTCVNCNQVFGYTSSKNSMIEICRTCFLDEKAKKEKNLKSKIV